MSVGIATVESGQEVLAEFESRPFFLVSLGLESRLPCMAQLQLPVFPNGVTQLSSDLGVSCREGKVSYFYGSLPVFAHDARDTKSFRMFLSQLYLEGKIKQAEAVRVFGISAISLKRAVKLYEQSGPGGFWKPRPARGPTVLTPEVLRQAHAQLDQRQPLEAVAAQLQIKRDTLQKAVRAGRLVLPSKKKRKILPPVLQKPV